MVAAQLLLVVAKTNASAARIVQILLMSAQLAIGSESWSHSGNWHVTDLWAATLCEVVDGADAKKGRVPLRGRFLVCIKR